MQELRRGHRVGREPQDGQATAVQRRRHVALRHLPAGAVVERQGAAEMIISFSWTTPALLAGRKTMTRRDWSERTAQVAMRACAAGNAVDAWSQTPRVKGARKVATIRLTAVHRAPSDPLPEGHHEREGFGYLTEIGRGDTVERVKASWKEHPRELWVVEFELVATEPT